MYKMNSWSIIMESFYNKAYFEAEWPSYTPYRAGVIAIVKCNLKMDLFQPLRKEDTD